MAAYCPAAFWTSPFCLFVFEQFLDTVLFNVIEVLHYTHPEISSVPVIKTFQPLAGKIITFITVFHFAGHQQRTVLYQYSALPVSGPAADAISHVNTFISDVMLEGKVPAAYGTVHAARGDQLFIHCSIISKTESQFRLQ